MTAPNCTSTSTSSSSSSATCTAATNTNNEHLQLLYRAAFLNGLGVAALVQQDQQEHHQINNLYNNACLQAFHEALTLMGRVSCCPNLDRTGARGSGTGTGSPVVWKSFSLPKLKDDRFFVCPQALLFSVSDKPIVSEADISFYCALVLHNMALTHHRLALLERGSDDKQGEEANVQQAQHLYEHSYKVLSTILSPPGDDIDMLKAVTLNNLAQIYYMTYRFDDSDKLLWEIRKLCPALWRQSNAACDAASPSSSSSSGSSTLCNQIIQEIVINVFFVAGHPSVAPSA